MRFTRFIWKVFATKILLSRKFLLFVTLTALWALYGYFYQEDNEKFAGVEAGRQAYQGQESFEKELL